VGLQSVNIRALLWRSMPIKRPLARGPFDIVGDVHGCLDELLALLAVLDYEVQRQDGGFAVTPPQGRTLVFAGDLVNRGPATPDVLRLAMHMVRSGQALCVPGNQDVKLARALKGSTVEPTLGLARALEQFGREPEEFRGAAVAFLDALPSHYVLDCGKLVIAHAGLPERMQGSASAKARAFAVGGAATGEIDEFGMPVRLDWASEYRGRALVVFGHTPVPEPVWLNHTVNIDTGCVYGGHLTALRYPELETVQVPAKDVYQPSRRRWTVNDTLASSVETGWKLQK